MCMFWVCREYCVLVSGCVCCKSSFPFFFLLDIMICSFPVRDFFFVCNAMFSSPLSSRKKKFHINSMNNIVSF
jgi:hypothetical protein